MVKIKVADNSEERIRIAARKVFMERGLSGARMQDIADEAGINKALLHYYFRNKEKLFEMIFREAFDNFFPKIAGLIASDISIEEKIEQFCGAYIDMLLDNPYIPLFVLNEVNKQPRQFREKFWKNREPLYKNFGMQIQAAIKKKEIKPVEPAHLFLNMISMCIFPFISKPMWIIATGMDESKFGEFMKERKKVIPKLIIDSIKK
jgi:AcrR family transcriptional regulator